MAAHSSVLAWRIPGMGLHRVGHDRSDLAAVAVEGWVEALQVLKGISRREQLVQSHGGHERTWALGQW